MELENLMLIKARRRAHRDPAGLFRVLEVIMTRREAREQAFCVLFEQAVTGESVDDILHAASEARDFIPNSFAEGEAFGVEEHRDEIDGLIAQNIRGWNIRRLSKVTLALLRLSIYEILYDSSIPDGVSINEAVELAKKYGGKDDAPYINGVLSSVLKGRAAPEREE